MPDNHQPDNLVHRQLFSFRLILIFCLSYLVSVGSMSAIPGVPLKEKLPEVKLPLIKQAPKIDGIIIEEEWRQACRVIGLMRTATWLEGREAVFWLACDGELLYIAVKSEAHPQTGIISKVKPSANDAGMKEDDTVEIWIDPRKGAASGEKKLFQIVVNHNGVLDDASFLGEKKDGTWRVKWEFASTVENGWWELEAAIHLASLGVSKEDLSSVWGMRIARNWRKPDWQTDWVMQGYRWERHPLSDRATMAVVGWQSEGVVTRMLRLRGADGKGAELAVELRNVSDNDQAVSANIQFQSEGDQPKVFKEELSLKAQESRVIQLGDETAKGECAANIKVTSGEDVLFYRAFRYYAALRKDRWWLDFDKSQTPEFDIAYYPSHNKLKARLIIKELKNAGLVRSAAITVKSTTSTPIAQADFPPFKNSVAEIVMDLPELDDGTYTAEAMLKMKDVKDLVVLRDFSRKRFDWERNDIGMTDKAYPPFIPVAVDGNAVSVVLRKHDQNPTGLWNQVWSESVPILAAPMRFETKINGRECKEEPVKSLTFTRKAENSVEYSTEWKAGSLFVKANGFYEMDGMMKIELVLNQKGNERVDNFDLVIPLKEEIATLMYAYSTKTRYNLSGEIPKGSGLVWESKNSPRYCAEDTKSIARLPGTFIPYIWIGNERQGVAWFADNDKDWLVDDVNSTHEIHRQDGAVVLKIHFVTKPGELKRERRFTFALQATPTKPMPDDNQKTPNWRRWRLMLDLDYEQYKKLNNPPDSLYLIDYLYGDYYGRADGGASSVYPAYRNELAYDIAGEVHKQGRYDEEKMRRLYENFKQNTRIVYSEHYLCLQAFDSMLGKDVNRKGPWVPYCNARGINLVEEFLVFQDEWLRFDYTGREWSPDSLLSLSRSGGQVTRDYPTQGGVWYDVKPVRSYQDFCLWWWRKMLEKGAADGIYFDDTFLAVNHDTVAGSAYYDDEGKQRQGVDLFAMRNLLKRAWILCSQLGMPMVNIAHMTGAPLIPINSWAAFSYDWEDKAGPEDFQDRFPRDLIRAQSIGLQAGNIPLVMGMITEHGWSGAVRNSALLDWISRTMLGVTMVHELSIWPVKNKPLVFMTKDLLHDFGYGRQDCQVWTYWQKDFPLAIKGGDAEGLVLKRGGQVLIVVADFGNGGKCEIQLDGKKLGLRTGEAYYDIETGERLEAAGGYGCLVKIPRHGFRVIGRSGTSTESAKDSRFTRGIAMLEGIGAGTGKDIELLGTAMQENSVMLKRMARRALALQGKAASGTLRGAFKSMDTETKALALSGLYEIGESVDTELAEALKGKDVLYRRHMVQALLLCGQKASEVVRAELKNPDLDTRMTALKGLGDLGQLTLDDAKNVLNDESCYLRYFAVRAIGEHFRDTEGAKLLTTLAVDGNAMVKKSASTLLQAFKKAGIIAGKEDRLLIILHKSSTPPVVDGKVSADEYGCKICTFYDVSGGVAKWQSDCYMSYDDKMLYIGLTTPVLNNRLLSQVTERDGSLWTDDSVEVHVSASQGMDDYYQFIFNSSGAFYDSFLRKKEWNIKDMSLKNSVVDGKWTIEMAFPFDAMGLPRPIPGAMWRVNVCRTFAEAKAFTCVSPVDNSYSEVKRFLTVQFDEEKK